MQFNTVQVGPGCMHAYVIVLYTCAGVASNERSQHFMAMLCEMM